MEHFKTKWFSKWGRKNDIDDNALLIALSEIESGIFAANLGGELYKIRIGKPGRGKSGGFRMIVVYRTKFRAIFLYGFDKGEMDNIDRQALVDLKKIGKDYLALNAEQIRVFVQESRLVRLERK